MPAHSSWRSSRRATWRRLYVAWLSGFGACCIARNRCRSPRGDDANVWTAVLYVGGYDVQWRVGACVVVCVRPGATAIRLSERGRTGVLFRSWHMPTITTGAQSIAFRWPLQPRCARSDAAVEMVCAIPTSCWDAGKVGQATARLHHGRQGALRRCRVGVLSVVGARCHRLGHGGDCRPGKWDRSAVTLTACK